MKKPLACSSLMAIFFFLLVGTTPALAEHRAEALYLSPSVGGYLFDDNQDYEEAIAYGLTLGFNYTKNWGTEFTLNYIRTEDEQNVIGDIDVGIFRWDVLYHFFPESPVIPYLAVGMGGLHTDPGNGDRDFNFMAEWGGGLKYYFTDNLALRADARHIYEVEDEANNFLFSGGLIMQFGGSNTDRPLDRK